MISYQLPLLLSSAYLIIGITVVFLNVFSYTLTGKID